MRTGTFSTDVDTNEPPYTPHGALPWLLISPHRTTPPPPPPPPPPHPSTTHPALVLLPSALLVRSASAPPDYVPPASLQRHRRRTRRRRGDDEDDRSFPEVVETTGGRRRRKECSECCMRCVVVVTTLRWLLVSIALLGAACVVAGIVFGVISSTLDKSTFFVLSFTFIGLGIVLVIVVCIGWRCAPAGHEPCHALCRLDRTSPDFDSSTSPYETAVPRVSQLMHRGRNQWYGGFLYPEFRYGTPPPSYSTSMEQYRQRAQRRTMDDGSSYVVSNSTLTSLGHASSLLPVGGDTATAAAIPPPSYHSRIAPRRIRPSIGGLVDLPPPYRSASRRPSAAEEVGAVMENTGETAVAAVMDEVSGTNSSSSSSSTSSTTTAVECSYVFAISDGIHRQSRLEDAVVEIVNETPQVIAPVLPLDISPARSPSDSPPSVRAAVRREAPPTVRSMVRRFEDLGRKTGLRFITAKIRGNSAKCDRRQSEDAPESFDCSSVVTHRFASLNIDEFRPNHDEITAGFLAGTPEQMALRITPCRGDATAVHRKEFSSADGAGGLNPKGASNDQDLRFAGVRELSDDFEEGATIQFVGELLPSNRDINFSFVESSADSSNDDRQRFCRVLSRGQSLEDPEIGESGI